MKKGHRFKEEPKNRIHFDQIALLLVCTILIVGGIIFKNVLYPANEDVKPERTSSSEAITSAPTLATVAPTSAPTVDQTEASVVDKSKIVLVNKTQFIDEDYVPELKEWSNGLQVSVECWGYLKTMIGACETQGMNPVICSAYRSYSEQEQLFTEKVNELLPEYDYNEMAAYYEAQRYVARPGASEHQLGLAVDIVDIDNQNLEEYQEDTPTQIWMINNSWKYGFILRYPDGTDNYTGVKYEPWHYRFVGIDAAKEIHEQGVCLEQYLKNDKGEDK